MPLINVHMASGRTSEQKRALMAALTQAAVEALDAPIGSVRVWIDEFDPDEFMSGGETLAERKRRS
jgi:4-oxalocrotonate tautomerase